MNNIHDIKSNFLKLYNQSGILQNEAIARIELVIKSICNFSSINILLNEAINKEQALKITNILNENIKSQKPIQYLLQEADFYNFKFFVNEHVLIPRPETELLVTKTLEIAKNYQHAQILDIGTGSGCIACSLAQNISCDVLGVDVSNQALHVALTNSEKFNLCRNVMFRKSNIFSNIKETFDIIVSNPPYIPEKEIHSLEKNVLEFEPHNALFAKDNGLFFYKEIIENAHKHLNKNGFILFECGINQALLIKEIFSNNNFSNIKIYNDLSGIERVIVAQIT